MDRIELSTDTGILLAIARGFARSRLHLAIELDDLLQAMNLVGASIGPSKNPLALTLRGGARGDLPVAVAMAELGFAAGHAIPLSPEAHQYLQRAGQDDTTADRVLDPAFVAAFREQYASRKAASAAARPQASPGPLGRLSTAPLHTSAQRVRARLEARFLDAGGLTRRITSALMEASASAQRRRGPLATLFFVGPTATGKSLAADCIAEALASPFPSFDDEALDAVEDWHRKTIDLSAYTSSNQNFGLVGLTPGYDSAAPGELTSWIREHPRSVIILDHLDHAHPNTQRVLLEMFGTGVLTDRYGFYQDNDFKKERIAASEVDVRHCIFIFIAGVGEDLGDNTGFFERYARQPGLGNDTLLDYLQKQRTTYRSSEEPLYDPGLLSALGAGATLLFPPLGETELRGLAKRGLEELSRQYQATYRIILEWSKNFELLIEASLLAHGAAIDARKLTASALRQLWLSEVDAQLLDPASSSGDQRRLEVRFAPGTLQALEPIKRRLGVGAQSQPDTPDLVHSLRRRHRAVVFDHTLDRQTLTLTLGNPRVVVPQRAEDFIGTGALVTEVPDVRFTDVQGHVVVKQRLIQVLHLLKDPEKLEQWGAAPPSGLLLYGPPGTGKTLLAKALAGEADLPFIAATGVDLLDPRFIQSLYQRARHYAPSLVFIDEIDVLGRRDQSNYVAAVNALLAELDGFSSSASPVFTVAATNLLQHIDPALLRPGRLGLHIEVPMLDREARRGFVARYQSLPGGQRLDVDALLDATTGLSGAELEAVRNEAAYALLREGRTEVDTAFLREIITTERYGPRSNVAMSERAKRLTALHEAGHAVVSMALFPGRRITQVSIVPRQRMLGFTVFNTEDDAQYSHTRARVLDELAVCLAGRVAQQQLGGDAGTDPDSGASDDIARATRIALRAAAQWALDPAQPPMDYTQLVARDR